MPNTVERRKRARSARDIIEMIFRHKWKVFVFFISVTFATLGILSFIPKEYTSTAKLMVRRGRADFLLPSSMPADSAPRVHKEWESEINTELEILESRELTLELIRIFGPEHFIKGAKRSQSDRLATLHSSLTPVRQWFTNIYSRFPGVPKNKPDNTKQNQMAQAVKAVEKNLVVEAREKSDIIRVSYTADQPMLARQVVEKLVDIYLDRRIDVHRVPGAYRFFDQQSLQFLQKLKDTEASVSTLKQDAGISSLEDRQRTLLVSYETIRELQIANQSELAAVNARVEAMQAMFSANSQTNSSANNSKLMDREEHQELRTTLRADEITLAALLASSDELERQRLRLRQEIAEVNRLAEPMRKLQREQALFEEMYRKYCEDKEQARINEELETKKISNVNVVQKATLPAKADPSGNWFKFFTAVLLGMVGSVTTAFAADGLDPTLHSAEDVFDRLRLNTLIELPLFRKSELFFFTHPYAEKKQKKTRNASSSREQQTVTDDYFDELVIKLISQRDFKHPETFVIGITSNSPGEGVSSIAANLAGAFARDDRFTKTLLLDASRSSLCEDRAGLMQSAPFEYRYPLEKEVDEETEKDTISITVFMDQLKRSKKEGYDVIVVDLPPAHQKKNIVRMAAPLDSVILTITANRVPWRSALQTTEFLDDAGANLCGIILNRKTIAMPSWLYLKL